MFQPEVVVKMAVKDGAVHIQQYGVYVIPVDYHGVMLSPVSKFIPCRQYVSDTVICQGAENWRPSAQKVQFN